MAFPLIAICFAYALFEGGLVLVALLEDDLLQFLLVLGEFRTHSKGGLSVDEFLW